MAITFEVLSKDIAGRLGRLKAGARVMKTPALLPVINPHLQPVSAAEMEAMGAEGVITNAYIFFRSREYRQRAIDEGLHSLLGFNGLIMTDSGSFQLSVYGDVGISNQETILFQQQIKSDIWVPLDIPTPPDADRDRVLRELRTTMARLREAREFLCDDAPIAGPVQGGIYEDLREAAGREVGELGFVFTPIGAVVPLMESYRYTELVKVVLAAKRGIPRSSCVHLFGAGHPSMFALAAAMGCDVFDSAAYALYAKEGRYLTTSGSYRIEEMTELPCACIVCRSHTSEEILHSEEKERLLALHNLYASFAEMARIRQAITDGVLWELVDERCRTHPQLLRGYRTLLAQSRELEPLDRVSKRRFFYRGKESCSRTEVIRYQEMLLRFDLSGHVAIAMDGMTREDFQATLFFKPPFGPYPAELRETFPIGQSEIPDWDEDMVIRGCEGITRLMASNPACRFTVFCGRAWYEVVHRQLPGCEVIKTDV